MKILVDKSFERDSKRLPLSAQIQLKEIIKELGAANSLYEVGSSKMEQRMPFASGSATIELDLSGGG